MLQKLLENAQVSDDNILEVKPFSMIRLVGSGCLQVSTYPWAERFPPIWQPAIHFRGNWEYALVQSGLDDTPMLLHEPPVVTLTLSPSVSGALGIGSCIWPTIQGTFGHDMWSPPRRIDFVIETCLNIP